MRPRSKTIEADSVEQYVKTAIKLAGPTPKGSSNSTKAKLYVKSLQKVITMFKSGVTNLMESIPEDDEHSTNLFGADEGFNSAPCSFGEGILDVEMGRELSPIPCYRNEDF